MEPEENDFDRVAQQMEAIAGNLITSTHRPTEDSTSDSVTMTKNVWIATVVDIGRLAHYVKGLAEAHREHSV